MSARRFSHELVDEITNFRVKFKTIHTLRALLTPGLLTAEYLAGRRQPHLSPFKVYLVCAAIFFLAAPIAGFGLASMLASDPSGGLSELVSARAAERDLDFTLFIARFDVRVRSVYTITLGAVAIVFALMLQVLFQKKDRPYGAHLIFALHFVSFLYLVTMLAGASRMIGMSDETAAAAAYVLILPYLFVALKRVYEESTSAILLKTAACLVLIVVLNGLASSGAIRLTLALV